MPIVPSYLAGLLLAAFLVSPAGAETSRRTTEFADATALGIADLTAQLRIQVGQGPGIQLSLTGPERRVAAIRSRLEGATLQLTDDGSGGSVVSTNQSVLVQQSGGQSRVIIGGVVQPTEPPLRVELTVPAGTPLALSGFTGTATIGDLDAPVNIDVSSGRVALGSVRDAVLNISGSGSIHAERVGGDVTAELSGSGDVAIAAGWIGTLRVNITGAGQAEVQAEAERAELSIAGAGEISVAAVRERPRIRVTGAGQVRVGNW